MDRLARISRLVSRPLPTEPADQSDGHNPCENQDVQAPFHGMVDSLIGQPCRAKVLCSRGDLACNQPRVRKTLSRLKHLMKPYYAARESQWSIAAPNRPGGRSVFCAARASGQGDKSHRQKASRFDFALAVFL